VSDLKPLQCPGCSAGLEYDPSAGKLKCPYCGTLMEVEPQQGAQPVVEIDYEEARRRAGPITQGSLSDQAVQVECATCGAAVVFEPPEVAGQCPFCTTKIVVQPHTPDPLITPQGLLPFAVPKSQAAGQLRTWLSSRWFAPSGLKQVAKPERLEGLYLPFWTYDAHAETRYTGQRGEHYWVQESYTEVVNGRPQMRTRSVRKTRWYPAAGAVENSFDDILVPASKSIASKRLDDLDPWGLEQVVPYNSSFLAGFKAQRYQVDLEEGFQQAQRRMEGPIRASICRDIGGDEQQIHSMNIRIDSASFKHLLLPVWLGAYRFKEKLYQIAVNARTGEVSGERPYSAAKIALLVLAILLAIAILAQFSKN
jgi:DNA-directed RNA polymerase subunit RPC12/RpoP